MRHSGRVVLLGIACCALATGCVSGPAATRCGIAANLTSGSGHVVDDATWNAHAPLRAAMSKPAASASLDCREARAILSAVDGPPAPPASLALTRGGATWFVDFLVAPANEP